jgi:hypothetical protein
VALPSFATLEVVAEMVDIKTFDEMRVLDVRQFMVERKMLDARELITNLGRRRQMSGHVDQSRQM